MRHVLVALQYGEASTYSTLIFVISLWMPLCLGS